MHVAEPLAIYSLHFDRGDADSGTVALWSPVTDTRLGEQPEWIRDHRAEPVAYVRGTRPSVQVSLLANHFVPASFELSAFGRALSPAHGPDTPIRWLGPHPVTLERTAGWSTLAEPVPFNRPLPNHIGTPSLVRGAGVAQGHLRRALASPPGDGPSLRRARVDGAPHVDGGRRHVWRLVSALPAARQLPGRDAGGPHAAPGAQGRPAHGRGAMGGDGGGGAGHQPGRAQPPDAPAGALPGLRALSLRAGRTRGAVGPRGGPVCLHGRLG